MINKTPLTTSNITEEANTSTIDYDITGISNYSKIADIDIEVEVSRYNATG